MGKSHDLATIADDGITSLDIGAGGLTVGTDQFVVDASGRVTMPYQPAFDASVWMGTYGTGTIAAQTKVLFNVNHNQGNHFANSRFTAPIAGRYFFYFNFEVDATANGRWGGSFRKNGAAIRQAIFYHNAPSGQWINISNSVVLDLAVNDYIEVYTENVPTGAKIWSGYQYGSSDNGGFGGHLIG